MIDFTDPEMNQCCSQCYSLSRIRMFHTRCSGPPQPKAENLHGHYSLAASPVDVGGRTHNPVLVSFAFSSCNAIVLVVEGKWKTVGMPLKFSLCWHGFDNLLSAAFVTA
jgi:hypothetical protein